MMGRFRPIADEINPDARPAVADPLVEIDEAGIGAWRDGDFLVMHKDAQLPPICVRTGTPATQHVPLKVRWYRSHWQLRLTHLPLPVPMCERWAWYSVVGRRVLMAIGVAMIAVVVSMCLLWHRADSLFRVGLFLGAAVLITSLLGAAALGEPLQFVRAKGNYLWFRGPDRRFLEQLPEWSWG